MGLTHLFVTFSSETLVVVDYAGILILQSEHLLLSILVQHLLISKVIVPRLDQLLCVFNTCLGSLQIIVKGLQFVALVSRFSHLEIVLLLQLADLPPAVGLLNLK